MGQAQPQNLPNSVWCVHCGRPPRGGARAGKAGSGKQLCARCGLQATGPRQLHRIIGGRECKHMKGKQTQAPRTWALHPCWSKTIAAAAHLHQPRGHTTLVHALLQGSSTPQHAGPVNGWSVSRTHQACACHVMGVMQCSCQQQPCNIASRASETGFQATNRVGRKAGVAHTATTTRSAVHAVRHQQHVTSLVLNAARMHAYAQHKCVQRAKSTNTISWPRNTRPCVNENTERRHCESTAACVPPP